jgi:hypothetical protein
MDTWFELNIRTQMEAIICRREGMIAENKQREHRGECMAYSELEFLNLHDEFMRLNEEIRSRG